jgi:hypothetical protein
MEAARTSETLVNFYQTTRCYNPEDSNLHTHRRENLKSHKMNRVLQILIFFEMCPVWTQFFRYVSHGQTNVAFSGSQGPCHQLSMQGITHIVRQNWSRTWSTSLPQRHNLQICHFLNCLASRKRNRLNDFCNLTRIKLFAEGFPPAYRQTSVFRWSGLCGGVVSCLEVGISTWMRTLATESNQTHALLLTATLHQGSGLSDSSQDSVTAHPFFNWFMFILCV